MVLQESRRVGFTRGNDAVILSPSVCRVTATDLKSAHIPKRFNALPCPFKEGVVVVVRISMSSYTSLAIVLQDFCTMNYLNAHENSMHLIYGLKKFTYQEWEALLENMNP